MLTIELVPGNQWGANLRNVLRPCDWDRFRRAVYARAMHRCEVCNGIGRKHPVECHEVWHYNDETHVQSLAGLIALCPRCHEVKHIGLAGIRGKLQRALAHLRKVNGFTERQTMSMYFDAFDVLRQREMHKWTLDLSWLNRGQARALFEAGTDINAAYRRMKKGR